MAMYRVSHFVTRFAASLLAGVVLAMLWANLAPQSYSDFVEWRLMDGIVGYPDPDRLEGMGRTLTMDYLSGSVLMALFFLFLGKELWEALVLEHGALRGRRAVAPLAAALAGAVVPVAIYLVLTRGAELYGAAPGAGWPVPVASDVALSYAVGRLVFGRDHPALRFLILMAIADDILGLLATGLAFPVGTLRPAWLLLSPGAALLVFVLFNWLPRRLDRGDQLRPASSFVRRHLSVWPYAVAGVVSWFGFQQAGLMPALGLLPVIPAIPHADRAFGIFAEAEETLTDTLNRMAHLLVVPVGAALFLFGLTHGGVETAAASGVSWAVAAAMLAGKPLGVVGGGLIGARLARSGLPRGMTTGDLGLVGLVAAVGLTVPFLAIGASLPGGALQDAARLGLLTGAAAALALLALARVTGTVRR